MGNAKESVDLMMYRLLQLEQRFEAYRVRHAEEIAEIQTALQQLRVDILSLTSETKRNGFLSPPPSDDPAHQDSFTPDSCSDELSL